MDLNLESIIALDEAHYMNNFGKRTPVCFTSGNGSTLTDTAGKTYLDLIGGIAVNVLGHGHPRLTRAICEQAGKLIHCSNLYYVQNQALLAQRLTQLSGLERAFLCNSGAEANEAAFKLARGYFHKKGRPRAKVVSVVNSFHGRTLATVTATGQPKYHLPFGPLPEGFTHVAFNDPDAMRDAIDDQTCAVIIELIQGESGIHPATREFVDAIVAKCHETGALLIVDEVQTGMGRTGRMFSYEHYGIRPDIVTLAKGLAGGLPIGACLATEDAATGFAPGDHGSTFGGGPLVCAGALAVLDEYEASGLVQGAAVKGDLFRKQLAACGAPAGAITEVRGLGLMIGIQLGSPIALQVKAICLERGYLVNSVGASVIRLLPPMILRDDEIVRFCRDFGAILSEVEVAVQ